MLDHLPDRTEIGSDHGSSSGHRLGHRQPKSLWNRGQMQACPRSPEELVSLGRTDRPDELDVRTKVRLDLFVEVRLILDDSGDDETASRGTGDVYGQMH